jgi:SAM-dependent methyltransferase
MKSNLISQNDAKFESTKISFPEFRLTMEENLRSFISSFNIGNSIRGEYSIPSYMHSNRLMAWLYWQRLKVVFNYLDTQQIGQVLDFGCGAGVMFPYLLGRSGSLFGYDIDLRASRFTINHLGLKDVTLIDPDDGLGSLEPGSFNTIIALDTMEHVDNLEEVLGTFSRLMSPDGQIIVSGPTETFFYRLGKKLAGFKGDYHERNIFDIERQMRSFFNLQFTFKLYPPITLFRVVVGRLSSHTDLLKSC